jgi:asparagine synthase (glutamine-hydrolysing)
MQCEPRVQSPLISGGLDSSSISCQAAHQLGQNNQPLFAMTAIPIGLDGPSYRKGWYYHEMPRVQSILNQYANIRHEVYSTKPDANIYELLHALYPHLGQPVRNVFNFDWIAASLEYAKNQKSRVLLTGQHGNGGFSWAAWASIFI